MDERHVWRLRQTAAFARHLPELTGASGSQRTNGVRELARLQWGMSSPPAYVKGTDRGVINIRNATSLHWRRWLKPESRCVVAATSFAEPDR